MVTARLLPILVWLLLCAPVAASDTPGARLWIEIETPKRAPYPQEMVLVRVRGLFTVPIALQELEQPDLPGFRWLTIGGDVWSKASDEGRPALGLVRTLALFPQRSGTLTIPAFVHHLTVVASSGERQTFDIASQPLSLHVPPAPDSGSGWWLPARSVKVAEHWSVAPDKLTPGQSTRRTITIDAVGLTDDQLPPRPDLRAPKLIAFPAGEERRTVVAVSLDDATAEQKRQALRRPGRLEVIPGPDGPRAHASYAWDIRPTTDEPVALPAIEIRWFNTATNTTEKALIPERTVAIDTAGPAIAAMEAELGIVDTHQDGTSRLADLVVVMLAAMAGFALAWRIVGHPLPFRSIRRAARRLVRPAG